MREARAGEAGEDDKLVVDELDGKLEGKMEWTYRHGVVVSKLQL